jgi:uncharacterized membrane protein YjgN (DUF898 family)
VSIQQQVAKNHELKTYPIRFTASGSEYLRIWIVNLLLIVVTLGIYYPWAKVRRLKYFYSNTKLDGHTLDFHGKPRQMLGGTVLAGVFLVIYSKAVEMPGLAALVAVIALVALVPALFRASMQFRLANTSWRGMRFSFVGSLKKAYLSVGVALAVVLLPGAMSSLAIFSPMNSSPAALTPVWMSVAAVLVGLCLVLSLPYLLWRIKRYQHKNYRLGSLQTQFRCAPFEFYKVVLKAAGVGLLGLLVLGGLAALLAGLLAMGGGSPGKLWLVLIFPALYLLFYMVVLSYWRVAMQNLVWSRTGNHYIRFVSDLSLREFCLLQLRNYFLIIFTAGLYWPFAVIATRRMMLESVVLRTRGVTLDSLTGRAQDGAGSAVGDAAADFFGVDVGL